MVTAFSITFSTGSIKYLKFVTGAMFIIAGFLEFVSY